ncbi:MAG: hypothetical protein HY673_15865, partial [Chloroflexi bacterium]|nr:hypothetical protein [Chloroflexota bacterium]
MWRWKTISPHLPTGDSECLARRRRWVPCETDVNGRTTTYEYDTFWRPIKLRRPGDETGTPTVQHQYQNWGVASSQNIYTIQKVDASTANDLWVKKYFDGVGRVVQTQAR